MTDKKRVVYKGKDHSRDGLGNGDDYFSAGRKLLRSSERAVGKIKEDDDKDKKPHDFYYEARFDPDEKIPPWFKKILSLKTDRGREKEDSFLLEGVRCIRDVMEHTPENLSQVLYTREFKEVGLLQELKDIHVRTQCLEAKDFKEVSGTVNGPGIIAICRSASMKPNWETARYVTLIDGVQDPGNLGSIFRTSLGFGMDAIVMGKGTVDPFNPKVVRGSSGTLLRMPFETRVDLAERITFLQNKGFTVLATSPHAEEDISDIKLRRKVAFLIGNEGRGADSSYMDMANAAVRIDTGGDLESLNVAVAHGILAHKVKEARKA